MKKNIVSSRNYSGQNLIEVVVGLLFLVPIVLFLIDMYALSLGNQLADNFAKDAARAAANQPNQEAADQAAEKAMEGFNQSPWVTGLAVEHPVLYVPNDTVTVRVRLNMKVPVPMPVIDNEPVFEAHAVQPIVTVSRP